MWGSAIAGVGLSAYQTISNAEQARDAKKALENYKRQELANVAKNLQVSTLGADLKREENARLSAEQVDSLRGSGTRGIVGGLPSVVASNQRVNEVIGADLDAQQKEIDRLVAQDDANIRGLQENREIADISALSSQYNAGQQGMYQGIGNGIQSIGMLSNNLTTPEGSARRQAWRDYKKVNPNASRSTFMASNPKNGYSYNNYSGQPLVSNETSEFVPFDNYYAPNTYGSDNNGYGMMRNGGGINYFNYE